MARTESPSNAKKQGASTPSSKVGAPAAGKKRSKAASAATLSKQDQRRTRSRTRILQAAGKAFGRHGYANTRVEDILEAASISRPTFYRFFRSKEHIFETIDEVGSLALLQSVSSAVRTAQSPFEKIEYGVDAYLRWLASAGPMAAVVRQESLRSDSGMAHRREATVQMLIDLFEEEMLAARGEKCDPWLLSVLIAGVEHAGELLSTAKRPTAEIQRAKDVVMRMFMAALTAEDSSLPPIPPYRR